MAARPWRFSVDTSAAELSQSDRPWVLSEGTVASFRQLAEASCAILSACRSQCDAARNSGRERARQALMSMLMNLPSQSLMPLPRLHAECTLLLAREEHPADGEPPRPPGQLVRAASSILPSSPVVTAAAAAAAAAASPAAAAAPVSTGWEAVDAMFTDEAFRSGCVLFTQFYRERTRELRVAFVCGFRDWLNEFLARAAQFSQGAPAVYVGVLVHLASHMAESETARKADDPPNQHNASPAAAAAAAGGRAEEDPLAHWERGLKRDRDGNMDTEEDDRPIKRPRCFY